MGTRYTRVRTSDTFAIKARPPQRHLQSSSMTCNFLFFPSFFFIKTRQVVELRGENKQSIYTRVNEVDDAGLVGCFTWRGKIDVDKAYKLQWV